MRKITADFLYPVDSPPIKNGVVIVDEDEKVIHVGNRSDFDHTELEYHKGILIPGFVNTHCHLELSHMKGLANTGTGLLPFLKHVVQFRNFPDEKILQAIDEADADMYASGIQAVGDISNKNDTFQIKEKSKIRYYSFIEMFDFLQNDLSEALIKNYLEVYHLASGSFAAVPHAPYTVSPSLFQKLNELNAPKDVTVSIHNQETIEENQLFSQKRGGFLEFYKDFNFSLDAFNATGKTSIHYALQHMDASKRTIFVHNTQTSPLDIEAAHRWSDHVYWATCPNANLYIENRLPDYQNFIEKGGRITIGTDSLTSNWQLSVLEEMKTISKYQSFISFDQLLQWATLNGAEALGMEDEIGSISIGKHPGILALSFDPVKQVLHNIDVCVKRLV